MATLTYVFDGDTIEVSMGDKKESVRFLGIDAPEMGHDGSRNECGAYDATQELRSLIPRGTTVTLIADPRSSDRDRFDRLLRYVEVDGHDVGQQLLERGLVGAWYPKSDAKPQRFESYKKLADQARSNKIGSWERCPRLGR